MSERVVGVAFQERVSRADVMSSSAHSDSSITIRKVGNENEAFQRSSKRKEIPRESFVSRRFTACSEERVE